MALIANLNKYLKNKSNYSKKNESRFLAPFNDFLRNYEQMKIKLHDALLSGQIDVNYYHIVMKQIDDLKKSYLTMNSYADSRISYIQVK